MRPLYLTMAAFGPYATVQHIDFTELAHHKLFLVTGPTGAGKTTIFDAISVALYGEASGDLRQLEQCRSHFASDNQPTEVGLYFELKGCYYYVLRMPKQLKLKARGEGFTETPPKAELYTFDVDMQDQLILNQATALAQAKTVQTGIKEVNQAVMDLMGLSCEQFRQIMMIPQGEFRKLLMAGSVEREQILNRLFDTGLFKQVERLLSEKSRGVEETLRQIETGLKQAYEQIEVPEDETHPLVLALQTKDIHGDLVLEGLEASRTQDKAALEAMEEAYTRLKSENQVAQTALATGREIQKQSSALEGHKKDFEALEAKRPEIEQQKVALSQGQKAQSLQTHAAYLDQQALEVETIQKQVQRLKEQLSSREAAYKQAKLLLGDDEKQARLAAIKTLEIEVNRLEGMYDSVNRYEGLKQSVLSASKAIVTLEKNTKDLNLQQEHLEIERSQLAKALEAIHEAKLKLSEMTQVLTEEQSQIKQIGVLYRLKEELDQNQQQLIASQNELKGISEAEAQAEKTLNQLKRDYHLGQAALLAKTLKDQDPCPVCGATHHPNKAKGDILVDQDQVTAGEKTLKTLSDKKAKCEQTIAHVKVLCQKQQADFNAQWVEFETACQPNLEAIKVYGGRLKTQKKEHEALYEALVKEIKEGEGKKDQIAQNEEKIKRVTESLKAAQEQLAESKSAHAGQTARLESLESTLPEALRTLQALKSAHQATTSKLETAKKTLEALELDLNTKQVALQKAQNDKEHGLLRQKEVIERFEQAKKAFISKQQAEGFKTPESYEAACAVISTLPEMENTIKDYEEKVITTEDRIRQLEGYLKDQPQIDVVAQEVKVNQLDLAIQSIQEQQQALRLRLKQQGQLVQTIKDLLDQRLQNETTYNLVGRLAQVTRGDNPKRITFERYVLAILLADILKAANHRLERMTEQRYRLVRSDTVADRRSQSGLELEVHDTFTGKQRSVKTLSGGETFKASLAMALGLSDVVQSYAGGVRLDTMFVDEGFGTLDADSLEQAMDCLMDLQRTGRLIGIISHVPELKERIEAQLEVTMNQQGSTARFRG